MSQFDAFVQNFRQCPACGKTFSLYVDHLPSQGGHTHWDCNCPHCGKGVAFRDGAFVHATDENDIPPNAVHATILDEDD